MDLIYNYTGIKREYAIKTTRDFRVSGLNKHISDTLIIASSVMELSAGTIVTLEQLNVNEFHPKMVKAYVPKMGLYIDAISLDELEETM